MSKFLNGTNPSLSIIEKTRMNQNTVKPVVTRKKLEKQTAKLNISDSVFFTGRIPPDQIYRFYNIGTVYVSASDFEVNSLSYIEAMACSLPIVCRKDMCLNGVLENGVNGYSFETGDDFCEYIMKILENII